MYYMFDGASSFNSDISNQDVDVGCVTNMYEIFYRLESKPLSMGSQVTSCLQSSYADKMFTGSGCPNKNSPRTYNKTLV